jgi:hypothetical protein
MNELLVSNALENLILFRISLYYSTHGRSREQEKQTCFFVLINSNLEASYITKKTFDEFYQ